MQSAVVGGILTVSHLEQHMISVSTDVHRVWHLLLLFSGRRLWLWEFGVDVSAAGHDMAEPRVDIVRLVVLLPLSGSLPRIIDQLFLLVDFSNLLRQSPCPAGVGDVVLVSVDVDQIFTGNHMRLVNVDVRPLLVCGQDELIKAVQRPRIVQNHPQVLSPLHVVLASVVVMAHVRDLLVFGLPVVSLPLVEVVLILIVDIRVLIVLVLLSNLEDDLVLLCSVLIVWVNEHELIVISHVVVLVDHLILIDDIQGHFFFLN